MVYCLNPARCQNQNRANLVYMAVKDRLITVLIVTIARVLSITYRFRVRGLHHIEDARVSGKPFVVALLHARLWGLISYFSKPSFRPWGLLCSQSRDGAFIASVLETMQFHVIRGSSGRGGSRALVEMIRHIRQKPECPISFTVDGSRGPRGYLKGGVVAVAQKSGASYIPLACSTKRAWVFRSWDRFCLPKPFACIDIVIGQAVPIPTTADETAFERVRLDCESYLLACTRAADQKSGFMDSEPLQVSDRDEGEQTDVS